jgi:hypothetical protein
MRINYLPLAAALAALAAPALAAPPAAVAIAPEYTSHIDASGVLHLKGYERGTGRPFRFRVSPSGHVRGRVGDTAIVFQASPEARDRAFREAEKSHGS